MLKITTKLKRVKYTRWVIQIVIWIIFSPLFLLHLLGHISEMIIQFISDWYFKLERKVVKKYKVDEIARKQYERNPEKFKDKPYKRKGKVVKL